MNKIFLSHSNEDKEFVRMLHASFSGMNIDAFLDEKDILVGESIPDKIYEGLDESTHLIYVISKKSIVSTWAKEELSIAKMREKNDRGYKILPLLIESVELPTSIAHVKYADFTEWRNPDSFRESFLQVLQALVVEPKLITNNDLQWFAKNTSKLRECIHWITMNTYEIRGGVYASFEAKGAHYTPTKWAIEDQTLSKDIKAIYDLIPVSIDNKSRLFPIRKKCRETLDFIDSQLNCRENLCDVNRVDELAIKLVVLLEMMENLRGEFEIILLAGVVKVP